MDDQLIKDLIDKAQQVGSYHAGFKTGTTHVPVDLLHQLEEIADKLFIQSKEG